MFRQKTEPIAEPVDYPAGTFVHTEKGYFYIVGKSKRYRITSTRVLNSWSPQRVVEAKETSLAGYRIVAKLKFRNGSLIWNFSDAKLYLIENGKRRWLKNPDWFYVLGLDPTDLKFNMKRVQIVSADEIELHPIGEDLN